MGITHSTPADGTFSGTGTTAWNADHVIAESGGQALTVGAIADNEFVKRSGTTLIGGTPSGNTDILAADAPNSDFDLTNGGAGGAVTILSKSIAGIVAKDTVELEIYYTIQNNSGANRTYTPNYSLGTLSVTVAEIGTIAAGAANRAIRTARVSFAISAANLGYAIASIPGSAAANANTAAAAANSGGAMWNTSTDDNTGTKTISLTMSSNSTTTTQTLTLHSYTIRKISSNP